MFSQIKVQALGLIGIIATALGFTQVASAQVSTTTLPTVINTLNSTWYSYFQVMLANFWPFVVGVGVILLVWHFGRRHILGMR